ncbi:MAG: AbrB/MazE/SpoVT family DNA-binding domain-containing protein [Opitutaceae bacterium]|nr:AbrB/MazE/SpoVT family DNA-binding domain-containing protein [Opitutaceae bacterium]
MKTAVQRWGNSLALRIPQTYAAETRISAGSEVELTLKSGALVVRAVVRKRHALPDLLKRITPANRHESVATGAVVGREVW